MSLMKWLKAGDKRADDRNRRPVEDDEDLRTREEETGGRGDGGRENQEGNQHDGPRMVYFVCDTPKENITNELQKIDKDTKVSSFF